MTDCRVRSRLSLAFVLTFVLSALTLPAHALEGRGYGPTVTDAQQRAAADLVGTIQTRVLAVVESCTLVAGRTAQDCGSRVLKRTQSDLPMLGLRYDPIPGDGERHGARALLDPKTALPLYRRKLADLRAEFDAGQAALPKAKDTRQRHALLTDQLARVRAWNDHRLVAVALGETVDEAPVAETALVQELEGLETSVDSLTLAARVLFRDVTGRLVNLEPVVAPDSQEVTAFGNALGKALQAEGMGRQGTPLTGKAEYRILDQGLVDVTLELLALPGGEVVAVRRVRLLPAAYAGYEIRPLAPDFEKLLREGVAVSGDLKIDVSSTKGGRNLLFRDGEQVDLLIRSNAAVWYYVVGHMFVGGERLSYLLPLHGEAGGAAQSEAWNQDDAPFVRYIPPDKVNHHLPIASGSFVVQAPFGVEHLQVIASDKPLTGKLPKRQWNRLTGYHEVVGSVGDPKQGVTITRGLRSKAAAEATVVEGALSFTTSAR